MANERLTPRRIREGHVLPEISVGEGALGSTGDVVGLGSTVEVATELVDQRVVVGSRAGFDIEVNTKCV